MEAPRPGQEDLQDARYVFTVTCSDAGYCMGSCTQAVYALFLHTHIVGGWEAITNYTVVHTNYSYHSSYLGLGESLLSCHNNTVCERSADMYCTMLLSCTGVGDAGLMFDNVNTNIQ